ncbi:MAG: HAD family phosphatase [Clostridia bacterium]|nr:HAD family phosphatase [Clostridia bacterium]
MIKAIIWDMDGTFINSEDYWTAMPRVWLKKHGIELTDEEWETAPWRTVGFRAMLRNIYEMGIVENPEPIDEAIVWCKDYMYGTIYQGDQYVKYKPNAPECLAAAYALDIPMCLITATIEPVTDYTLDRLGIAHYFCFRQSTANGMKKDNPEIFRLAAERMGVKVEECLLVEDSLYSMKAGRAAGCTVWAIEDPKHKRDLEVIHQTAHRYFNNHVEMRQAFEELKAQN